MGSGSVRQQAQRLGHSSGSELKRFEQRAPQRQRSSRNARRRAHLLSRRRRRAGTAGSAAACSACIDAVGCCKSWRRSTNALARAAPRCGAAADGCWSLTRVGRVVRGAAHGARVGLDPLGQQQEPHHNAVVQVGSVQLMPEPPLSFAGPPHPAQHRNSAGCEAALHAVPQQHLRTARAGSRQQAGNSSSAAGAPRSGGCCRGATAGGRTCCCASRRCARGSLATHGTCHLANTRTNSSSAQPAAAAHWRHDHDIFSRKDCSGRRASSGCGGSNTR